MYHKPGLSEIWLNSALHNGNSESTTRQEAERLSVNRISGPQDEAIKRSPHLTAICSTRCDGVSNIRNIILPNLSYSARILRARYHISRVAVPSTGISIQLLRKYTYKSLIQILRKRNCTSCSKKSEHSLCIARRKIYGNLRARLFERLSLVCTLDPEHLYVKVYADRIP